MLLFILGASGNSTSLPIQSPALVSGVISTPRFRLIYTDRSRGAAQKLAERIESVRDQFQQVLGRDWPGVTEIRLGVGRKELEGLSVPNQKPPRWAAALAYPELNLVLLAAMTLPTEPRPAPLPHYNSPLAPA